MRSYTRSSPASIHIGKDAGLSLSRTPYSGSIMVCLDDENGNHAGVLFMENQEALDRFVEALKERVEA